jgi:hypothetical protein
MSNLAHIGHNQPPGPLDYAALAVADLSKFLTDTPVIETEQQASDAGLFIERMRKSLADVEAERDSKVRPLNEQVDTINTLYKAFHNKDPKKPGTADKLLNELRGRVTAYAQAEELRRIQEAEQARLIAEEAEQRAREAERIEAETKINATVGELVDVAAAIITADQTFSEFERAQRDATRAERDVPVRIGSRLGGKALTMRTTETLILESYGRAIKAIGQNEKIREAILSAARDYRKLHGALPDGVTAETSRSI